MASVASVVVSCGVDTPRRDRRTLSMRRVFVVGFLTATLGCASAPKPPSPRLVARADSLSALGDTNAALALLDSIVHKEPRNAAAWNRRGMLAWAFARPTVRMGVPTSQRNISLMRMVDSSLRFAAYYAPDSARYALDLGRFFLHANVITMRVQAPKQFEHAIVAARRAGDSSLVAEVLDELAMVHWREYERFANHRELKGMTFLAADALLDHRNNTRTFLESYTFTPSTMPGEASYRRATDDLAEAQRANPRAARIARHRFMALAEQNQWEELEAATELRIASDSNDATAWLANGLAHHRLNDEPGATPAFEHGLSLLNPADRARYTNLSRIMRRTDSVAYASATAEARVETNRMYWTLADPLSLTPDNEHRLEFLSRVVYSELRWTSDDLDLSGADSDRGQILVRYGPPPVIASFSPINESAQACGDEGGKTVCGDMVESAVNTVLWYYPDINLPMVFRAPPTYGVASFTPAFASQAATARTVMPASFRNVEISREMDSILVQPSRFRTAGDSTDVVTFAEIPLRGLSAGTDLARGAVDIGMTTWDTRAHLISRDSTRVVVRFDKSEAVDMRVWRRRHAPGTIVYRIEAYQPDAMRGARAQDTLHLAASKGFGLSDLLVGERVVPRDSVSSGRWSDMLIVPSAGTVRRGQSFGVLWESYDLAERQGSSRYRVDLALTVLELDRTSDLPASKLDLLSARVLGGIADAIGLSAKGSDRVSLSYTRQHDARPVALNYLTIELGDAPLGRYRLRVEVTDLATTRRASAERLLKVIR